MFELTNKRKQSVYWRALGQFISEYAKIERYLFILLGLLSSVSFPKSRALFSGIRVEGAISSINRLLEVSDESEQTKSELADVFAQIAHINNVRNSILHYGMFALDDDDSFVSSNMVVALSPSRLREYEITVETLGQLTHDCEKAAAMLFQIIAERDNFRPDDRRLSRVFRWYKRKPWLYRPPQQQHRREQHPAKTHAPQHRTKPSRK